MARIGVETHNRGKGQESPKGGWSKRRHDFFTLLTISLEPAQRETMKSYVADIPEDELASRITYLQSALHLDVVGGRD